MSLVAILTLGFVLGMRHATDADHVVAVTTLVARERSLRVAAALGALWGVGHTLTVLLVGGAIVLFGVVLPARVGLTMELAVAVMLVVLGAWNVASFVRRRRAGDDHGGNAHPHAHQSRPASTAARALRPLFVGVVHGLAGSAAIALLVLATIHDARLAIAYLAVFGVGTVAGMMLVTSALAVPMAIAGERWARVNRHLGWTTGLLSVAFGMFLAYRIGAVDGLFSAHPRWTPE